MGSAKVNLDALRLLLERPGQCPLIGVEQGKYFPDGISRLDNSFGSIRFILSIENQVVSALQVMASDRACIATNAYTDAPHQRMGYASKLAERALQDFPSLQFSDERSSDGQFWVSSLATENPLLYHGTKAEFTEFSLSHGGEYGSGIYLTTNIDSAWKYAKNAVGDGEEKVLAVKVKIQNPFFTKDREKVRSLGVKNLLKMGYDGIIATGQTGERQHVAFHAKQLEIVEVITANNKECAPSHRP